MAFRLEDFKKTTRKGTAGAPTAVYPHQIKEKKALARLEIAIRTYDDAVGRRRRDMDAQAMTDFFGDPRIARGMVACLGQFYRYETPDFAQLVGRDAAGRLQAAGLTRPAQVRACTYAHVNEQCDGFLTEGSRAECYAALGDRFCLSALQWDTLLHSDGEDNQMLTRLGNVPAPADIVALYNFHALDTVLRRATQAILTGLGLTAADSLEVRALARALGVKAVVSGDGCSVTLTDPETASPLPSLMPRRAGRLGRCLLHLIGVYATRSTGGSVDAKLGPKAFRLTLTPEMLRVLGMPAKKSEDKPAFRRRFEAGAALHKEFIRLRTRGENNGWRVKRLPEPTVTALGVGLPDFCLSKDDARLMAFLAPPSLGGKGAGGLGNSGGSGSSGAGEEALFLPLGRKPLCAADVLVLADARTNSLFALPDVSPSPVPRDVLALCDRAASEGLVKSADARRTLHLLDESPLIEWVRQVADPRVRYIPGVGLCSQAMVAAIRDE